VSYTRSFFVGSDFVLFADDLQKRWSSGDSVIWN